MHITRQALYKAVWNKPRNRLAKEWHMEPMTITQACKAHNIPLPPNGYWTKLATHTVTGPQPELAGNVETVISLMERPVPKSIVQVDVTKRIEDALPAIRKAFYSYTKKGAKLDYRYQYVLPPKGMLQMKVMPEMVEYGCLINDSLAKAFKARGWPVQFPSHDKPDANLVTVEGVPIHFVLTEQSAKPKRKVSMNGVIMNCVITVRANSNCNLAILLAATKSM